jgi:hypothetical protein
LNEFTDHFGRKGARNNILALQQWLSTCCLRRTKKTRDADGKKLLDLVERHIHLVEAHFSDAERDYYTAIEQSSRLDYELTKLRALREKKWSNQMEFSILLVKLLRMRQTCLHIKLTHRSQSMNRATLRRELAALRVTYEHSRRNTSEVLPAALSVPQAKQDPAQPVKAGDGKKIRKTKSKGDRLPAAVQKRLRNLEEMPECPICLEEPQTISQILVFTCGHILCQECAPRLFLHSKSAKCPLCNAVIQEQAMVPGDEVRRGSVLMV